MCAARPARRDPVAPASASRRIFERDLVAGREARSTTTRPALAAEVVTSTGSKPPPFGGRRALAFLLEQRLARDRERVGPPLELRASRARAARLHQPGSVFSSSTVTPKYCTGDCGCAVLASLSTRLHLGLELLARVGPRREPRRLLIEAGRASASSTNTSASASSAPGSRRSSGPATSCRRRAASRRASCAAARACRRAAPGSAAPAVPPRRLRSSAAPCPRRCSPERALGRGHPAARGQLPLRDVGLGLEQVAVELRLDDLVPRVEALVREPEGLGAARAAPWPRPCRGRAPPRSSCPRRAPSRSSPARP